MNRVVPSRLIGSEAFTQNYSTKTLRIQSLLFLLLLCTLLGGAFGTLLYLYPMIPIAELRYLSIPISLAIMFAGTIAVIAVMRGPGWLSPFLISRDGLWVGLLAVTVTFLLALMASWGSHVERHNAAKSTLYHYSALLDYDMGLTTRLFDRAAYRWASLDYDVRRDLTDTGAHWYFRDSPALRSLLIIADDGSAIWHRGKSPADLLWLTETLPKQDVSQWIQDTRSRELANAWYFPFDSEPSLAMLMITPSLSPKASFIAMLDLRQMLERNSNSLHNDFTITIEHGPPAFLEALHHQSHDVYERVAFGIPNGPGIHLAATAGPIALMSVAGAFPFALFLFGLVTSYLLVMGRSVLAIKKKQALELNSSVQQFRSLFSQSPESIFAFDCKGIYQSINPVAQHTVGLTDKDMGVVSYHDLLTEDVMTKDDYTRFDIAFRHAVAAGAQMLQVQFKNAQDLLHDYEIAFVPIMVNGAVVGVFGLVNDITQRIRAEERQRVLQKSLESSNNAVLVVDIRKAHLPVIFTNPAFLKMTGYGQEEAHGAAVRLLAGPETESDDIEAIRTAIESGEPTSLTMKSYRKDGAPFWNQLSLAPVKDESGSVTHFAALMTDISEKKEQEHRLAFQATHDVLTGLPNRALFEDRLAHDFELTRRGRHTLAVMFIDLDEFKPINDTLGHKVGDELLISVARALKTAIRPSDTLARFGGDEFVLLLPDLDTLTEAEDVANRILDTLGRAHRVANHELYISASIGIALQDEEMSSPEKLIQQADMAMYKAKQQGRDTFEVYSGDLDSKLSKRVTLRNDLQEAIQKEQFYLHYQPQVDQHGRYCGLEALVRWNHPTKGLISPADFIPVAEETGQIIHLGKWITTQACRDAKLLLEMGLLRGRMSVNLSPLQFHRPGFLNSLSSALKQTGLPAACLELELTEGILMKDSQGAIDILQALNNMGVTASIDDFGTGFSSFSYLKDLPIHTIKIDKSFVDDVVTNTKDAAVCKGIITMAREMGLSVVAEGVETPEQFSLLKAYNCGIYQGYLFARPMNLEDLLPWIHNRVKRL